MISRLFHTRPAACLLAFAAIALTFAVAVTEAKAKDKRDLLGSYRDWDALTITKDNGDRECYMISVPKRKSPDNVGHGEVYVTITHRPRVKIRDEINVVVGFKYRINSEVRIGIGSNNFRMFTEGDGAWLRTPREDRQLVAAMKAGSSMLVRGTSSRGTDVSYRFSLIGFTAAYNAIARACG